MNRTLAYLIQVQIMSEKWTSWWYYGTISDIHFCGRALQSPIPSASADASCNLFKARMGWLFCEIAIFQQNLAKR